ncbi:MAG TPA: linear amide C-N hydrolase [Pseudonocardiaceae bacterium]
MSPARERSRRWAALAVLLLVAAFAVVAGERLRPAAGPTAEPPPAAADQVVHTKARRLVVRPTAEDTARSVATFRALDEHPLYAMTYHGPAATVAVEPDPSPRSRPQRRAFACTVFAAAGDPAAPLLGRNFDWDHNPALVLHSQPRGGYRSVALVDLSYLGVERAALDAGDPTALAGLMQAVALPFDGMNEHGLAIGMAAVDEAVPELRPGRPAVGGIGVMRLVLDHARTVTEAVDVLGSYNLDFAGGPGLHYLIADATGASTVVEFVAGRMVTVPRVAANSWQVMENFHLAGAADPLSHTRWSTADSTLRQAAGAPGVPAALDLLRQVAQAHTQWSAVFHLATRETVLRTTRGTHTLPAP